MKAIEIQFCPSCGKASLKHHDEKSYRCEACDFIYYHNIAAATVAIIRYQNEILFTFRAFDPFKGMLDLPGGFQERGESYEAGLQRELHEELGILIDVDQMQYLFSYPNTYPYKGLVYYSTDAYFEIVLDYKPKISAGDDVQAVKWLLIEEIKEQKIAFENMKKALTKYIDGI
ncbi:MAG: NUDIX domain-containing protein [Campylobacterota bacterium]|nr:NUDIX domain-containing protein [Campylobacterota bacterium]